MKHIKLFESFNSEEVEETNPEVVNEESVGENEVVRGEFKSFEELIDFVNTYSAEFTDSMWDIIPQAKKTGWSMGGDEFDRIHKDTLDRTKGIFDKYSDTYGVMGIIIAGDEMYGYFRDGDNITNCYRKDNSPCEVSEIEAYLY